MSDWLEHALGLVEKDSGEIFPWIGLCSSIDDLRALFAAVCNMPPTQFRINVLKAIIDRIQVLAVTADHEEDADVTDLEEMLDAYITRFGLRGTPPPPVPDDHGYGR
ncbi:hypothetical protein [Xylophilus ampelinus]|uniref:hypothetical protein n=1 Tax=Xylophilus ampelinus TaxID=54067 RepID=UPI0011B59289|nr:hypothetical protein [Xylophilus ampelinus]MCS4509147.1 hypothetical protein [Xylophilus ampelinus]